MSAVAFLVQKRRDNSLKGASNISTYSIKSWERLLTALLNKDIIPR